MLSAMDKPPSIPDPDKDWKAYRRAIAALTPEQYLAHLASKGGEVHHPPEQESPNA